MAVRIAVNGIGRIGRCVIRALFEHKDQYPNIELVAVNGPAKAEMHRYLLQYDSVHGMFNHKVTSNSEDELSIDGEKIKLFHEKEISKLPWKELNIDIVMECTGVFRSEKDLKQHLASGAKKVMLSAPAKENTIKTIVKGVNDDTLTNNDTIISIGSCTTNCLAPLAKVLNDKLGIEKGHMTTVHSYTNDQRVLDGSHKKDLRRGRACALSMIPTSTGAAKALGLVIPSLDNKIDGIAIRVPTPNVSLVDLSFISKKDTTIDEVNSLLLKASQEELKGVLEFTNDNMVSVDFTHNIHSSIFDASQTKVISSNFVRVASWYDNEWGFSNRMLDIAKIWK